MDNFVPVVSKDYKPTGLADVGSIQKLHGQLFPAVSEHYQYFQFDKYRSIYSNLGLRWARSTC